MDSYDNKMKNFRNHSNDNYNKFDSLCDENQHEMQSMEMESRKSSMETNTTADAILYYQYVSQQMENEIMELEKAIENYTATNKTQKQNIMDMQIQKQKMLSEFHEQYRKYEQKIAYESILEDQIENVARFLQELITQKTEISNMKTAEIQIRDYIINKFQSTCEELQEYTVSYEKDIEQIQEKINEIKEVESQEEAYKNMINQTNSAKQKLNEQMNQFKWCMKNESVICEQIKTDGNAIQTQLEMKLLEKKQKLKNDVIKTQRNFCFLKNEFCKIKDQPKNAYFQQHLEKLQKKLAKKIQQRNEINSTMELIVSEIEVLKEKNENDFIQLESLKDKIEYHIKEKDTLMNYLVQLRMKTNDETVKEDEILKRQQLGEIEIKHIVAEKEKLKQRQKLYQIKNEFLSKCKQIENFFQEINEFKRKKDDEKQQVINLKAELNMKAERINKFKNNLSSITIQTDDDSEKEDFINAYLTAEYEQNTADKFIDFQLDILYERICTIQPHVKCLNEKLEESIAESFELDQTIVCCEKTLQNVTDKAKVCENSIQAVKQNVYQGKYITQQDLNKKLNIMITGEKNEQIAVDKLKEETSSLEKNQKRPLLPVENKPKSNANRTTRSKLKPVNYKEDEEAVISSPDSDIYTFK